MITQEKIVDFIRSRPGLKIPPLEKEAGIPPQTLSKALLANASKIPAKHLPAIEKVLRQYGYTDNFSEGHRPAQVISIVNHKGGVGKTTTVINLAKALSLYGLKVLMIDMDSQGNLSQCYNVHEPKQQVIDSLLSDANIPIVSIDDNLDLAPSDIRMAARESDLTNSIGSERRLTIKINQIRDQYDYILIDCPPSLGICTTCSLVASDGCIVPIQAEASAYHGVANLLNHISDIRTYANPILNIKGFVFTMIDKRLNLHADMMEHIKNSFKGVHIFDTVISQSKAVKESQVAKEDLFTSDPTSVPWTQYKTLATELLNL
ncbi:ParA family protein [Arundinibacter roseus]|uniref:ParA family protein n=1 Tax=Arundinibacter roseus TaxID=2070510 RepID=A0A4R4JXF7_9BACT|nr:ParA family protein [Arundinibacter roseus]TDB59520.1 ParA family protein [Arundinibacter roseus]